METPETDRFRQTIRASLKRIDPLMDDDAIDGHSIMVAFDYAVAVLCRHINEQNQTIAGLEECNNIDTLLSGEIPVEVVR